MGRYSYNERKGNTMQKQKAVIISTDGSATVAEFELGESYKMLSNAVGGYIECVRLSATTDLWCNENGIAEGLPLNLKGSAIYLETFNAGNPILGNIVITGGADDEGETLGLTDEQVAYWLAYSTMVIPTAYLLNSLYE